MTTRRWMFVVAAVAFALGVERGTERWNDFRQRAEAHEGSLRTLAIIRQYGYYPYCCVGRGGSFPLRYDAETAHLHAEYVSYHTRLMTKYRSAACLPWLSVDPDASPPDSRNSGQLPDGLDKSDSLGKAYRSVSVPLAPGGQENRNSNQDTTGGRLRVTEAR
jgi:hypothetical protein